MVSESRNYGRDLSCGKWKWHSGGEFLPVVGCLTPPKGIGIFLNTAMLPNATVIKSDDFSMWIRVPGAPTDLYICGVYLPCYPRELRAKVLETISDDLVKFQKLGMVIIGGDMNARCGMNGDEVTNTCGRRLMNFCYIRDLCIVNDQSDICSGDFTRVLKLNIAGQKVTHETTIDYVLVPAEQLNLITHLGLIADSELDSDHKPLVVSFLWSRGKSVTKQHSTHLKWRVTEMATGDWNFFEVLNDKHMMSWLDDFTTDQSAPKAKLEKGVKSLISTFEECAAVAVGRKV